MTGDVNQVDLRQKSSSGFRSLLTASEDIRNMYVAHMSGNYRNEIVRDILTHYI